MLSSFSSFGVCGSRAAGSSPVRLASLVVPVAAHFGAVSCGCARGVDAVALPFASSVFSVSIFGVGRGAFARRSVSFVRALAGSSRPVLLCFPSGGCPTGLFPSASPARCFAGFGSGSWAAAAFADLYPISWTIFYKELTKKPRII